MGEFLFIIYKYVESNYIHIYFIFFYIFKNNLKIKIGTFFIAYIL